MDKQINVSITPGTIITTILIIAGAYALWILRGLILLILTAVIISSAIEPGVVAFRKWRVPRVLAVTIMYILVFGSFFGLIYFFFPPVLSDTENFLSIVPQYLNTLNLPPVFDTSLLGLTGGTHQSQSIFQTLFAFQSAFSVGTTEGSFRLLSTFFGGIFSLFIVVVLSFYFAIQDTGVEDFLKLVTPRDHEEYVVDLWHRAQVKIGQWMQGQLLLSLIASVIVYLGLLIIGVPDALMLAVFTAIAELIPIFGSFIAGFPAVIIAFSSGGVPLALIVAGLFIIVNQFEGNLIHPLVVKKVVGVPPLLVLIAIIAGGDLAGFLGVLLAVPLAAVLREALADFDKRKRRLAAAKG
ncbi:MAG: AI-2E family transporter [Candidatus Pacebacteria bacterium]|nr:AI-2E family transporter [Candidatus Paceibacterota bacterium]